MYVNGTISKLQFFTVLFFFTIGNTIINAPAPIVSIAKQDGWISSILALILGMFIATFYFYLYKRFSNKNLIDICLVVLGKWLGTMFVLLFLLYFFLLASLMVRQFSDFMVTIIMPETPSLAIQILLFVCIIVGATLGIEAIGRTAEIILPFSLIVICFFLVFLIPEMETGNLKPYIENGLTPIFKGTWVHVGLPFLQLIVFLIIFPTFKELKKTKSVYLLAIFLGGLITSLTILYSILTIGVSLTELKHYPTYFMAQKISLAGIIERLEVFIAGLWFITIYFKTTILLYATVTGLNQLLKIANPIPNLFALSYLLLILTQFISPNVVYFHDFFLTTMPFYSLTMGLILPLIIVLISFFRKSTTETSQVES